MFMYATFDRPVTASGKIPASGRDAGYVKFDTTADKTVTMRIATSLIGVEQARKNLELEIAPSDTFDAVKDRAQQRWDQKLGVIEVEGASDDQLTTPFAWSIVMPAWLLTLSKIRLELSPVNVNRKIAAWSVGAISVLIPFSNVTP